MSFTFNGRWMTSTDETIDIRPMSIYFYQNDTYAPVEFPDDGTITFNGDNAVHTGTLEKNDTGKIFIKWSDDDVWQKVYYFDFEEMHKVLSSLLRYKK